MSAFVVSNIAADLKMLTNDQRFIFGDNILPEPLASFKIDNIFEPDIGMPSVSNFEMRNSSLSGFRWIHTTTNTDTFGSLKLQSFVNAASTGTDILLFNQDGTVVFNAPVSFPGFVVSGDFDMNDYKIINLLDPTNPQDGATKAYVDSLIGSGTVTLSGAVSGTGDVGSTIVTTLTDIDTSQITDFTTAVSSFRLDEFALPTSNIDLNSNKIINLATPTLATDGATKGYVDSAVGGSSITLTGAVTGSGSGTIDTTLTPITTSQITDYVADTEALIAAAIISPSQLTDYPATNTTYLRGDGVWANFESASAVPSIVNVTGDTQSFLYSSVFDSFFNLQNTTVRPAGAPTTTTLRILNPADGGYRLNHVFLNDGIYGGFGTLSLDAISMFGDIINFINFDFNDINGGVGFMTGIPNTTFGASTSETRKATLSVNSGPQNITNESSCFRVLSNDNATKIELQNTSVGGKLYELRSNLDGSFAITDRTASATKLSIDANSITANSRVQVTPTTTNVNRKVVLVETANNDHQFIGLGANSGVLRYQVSSTSGSYIWYAGTSSTTSTQLMRLEGDGQLFLTTAQTTSAINVNNTNTSSTVNDISFSRNGVLRCSFGFDNLNNEAYVSTNGTYPIKFTINGFERLRITENRIEISPSVIDLNRKIVFAGLNNDHQFLGFGINNPVGSADLRYQLSATTGSHIWYAGVNSTSSNELMRLRGNGDLTVTTGTIYGRRVSGTISMQNNITGTVINTANLFTKVLGTTTSSNLNQMSMPQSNRITYTGITGNSIVALITCSFSATFNTGASNEVIFAIYKNGALIPESRISFDFNAVSAITLPVIPYNISITTTLNNNDYVELWVTMNADPRTVTVSRLMMTVIAI